MLHDYNKVKKHAQHMMAIDEDGNKYEGEFIDLRVDPETVPGEKYYYPCRHDDNGECSIPVTIEEKVIVNFCGTFITDKPINFPYPDDKFIPLDEVYLN